MHTATLITRMLHRLRVEWLAAGTMLALAYFTLTARSLTVIQFRDAGLTTWQQAALLALGAVMAIHSRGRDWLFYLATVPLLGHVVMSVTVILNARAGYHQLVIYVMALALLYLEYTRQETNSYD